MFNRSSNRGFTRSSAAASQGRSGAPAKTPMMMTAHAIKPPMASNPKKVVASVLLVTHPRIIAAPNSSTSQAKDNAQQEAVLEEPQPFPAELRSIQAGLDYW